MTDPNTPNAQGANPSGGPSPATQPSGAGIPNPGAQPSSSQRTETGKVKVRAIHMIVHDDQTIQPGTKFSGDAKDIIPLVESGAAEYWPPRAEDSPAARNADAQKARRDEQTRTGSAPKFNVDAEEQEANQPGTPQERMAIGTREQVGFDAEQRARTGGANVPVVDAFGRPASTDANTKEAESEAQLSRTAADLAKETAENAAKVGERTSGAGRTSVR